MTYEYIGKVVHILPVEDISRTSKTFKKKQTIICQEKTDNQIAFLLFDSKIEQIETLGIQVGDKIKVTFSIKARYYRNEWVSNAYALVIEKVPKRRSRTGGQQREWSDWKQSWEQFNQQWGTNGYSTSNWFKGCVGKDEIKKRYRELCKEHHPDKGGNQEIMQEINIEYDKIK